MTGLPSSAPAAPRDIRFWDRIAKKYAAEPVADEEAYQRKLAMTRELIAPPMKALEFGCGTGSTAIALAPHLGKVEAIDCSANMIEIARAKASEAGVANIQFEVEDFATLQRAPASYDVVFGHSILHLMADRQAVIEKVRHLLKPDGLFISSTACLGDKMAFMKWVIPLGQLFGRFPHVEVFRASELLSQMRQAGFSIEHEWQPERSHAVFVIARAV
jgi:ubiquinone/menaquinone biosynthesis C-methylase UbiE